MKFRLLSAALALGALLGGCSSEAPNSEAQRMTIKDFKESPTFYWFPPAMDAFSPNTEMVGKIKGGYDPATDKLAVFVKPSCSCKGTQYLFPQVMKTITDAGLDMSTVEIWSMKSIADKQPYATQLTITDLPAIYVFRNGAIRNQVRETEYNEHNADTLLARAIAE